MFQRRRPIHRRSRFLRRALSTLALCGLLFSTSAGATAREELSTPRGGVFPNMVFGPLALPEDYEQLGLAGREDRFRLEEIPGELLVVEFFSPYCSTCRHQAPYLEAFSQAVRAGGLAGRVRLLSVAVGAAEPQLQKFRDDLNVSYPMAADPEFEQLLALGNPRGTPFTVFLQRREQHWLLADYHLGLQDDSALVARVEALVEGRTEVVRTDTAEERGDYHPPLGLSETQQQERAAAFLSRLAGETLRVVTIDVPEYGRVYQALGADDAPRGVFARIASRDPICDICHAVHFLFAFDAAGMVLGFEPIHVTKYANETWSDEDAARLNQRLRERSMAGLVFNPAVDAVSRATMSSALIFNEVRRAASVVARLAATRRGAP